MNKLYAIVPAVLFATASSSAIAQDRTIDGNAISADQMTAIEDRCDELQAQQGTTGTQEPETTLPETADADQASAKASGTDEIDVASVTLEQCKTGGFISQRNAN